MSSGAQDITPAPESPVAGWRNAALATLVIVVATFAAYHNCWRGEFVFDDQSSILENASIRQLWPLRQVLDPPPDAGICGRPFANLTVALNYAVSGFDVRGYRAVNFAIHVLTALALFGVVRRTLLLPRLRDRFGRDAPWIALAAAGMWALHPLTTIVVNYISQRVEGLMGLFYLVTLYGFIRSAYTSSRLWPWLTFAACLLGMASKEVMVTAPVLIFLYDRTFVAGSFRAAWSERWRIHLTLAATWVALAYFMAHAQLAQRGIGFALGVSPLDYALNECRAVLLYLKLAFWPQPLVFDYGWDFVANPRAALPYVLGLGGLGGLTVFALWRRPMLGFFGAWFFGVLAPSSSIVPLIQQPIAESRVYLPLVAVTTLAGVAFYRFGGRRSLWVCGVLGLVGGVMTVQRNSDYRTEISLWTDTAAKSPNNARAQANLGAALLRKGRNAEAIAHLENALTLKSSYPEAQNNLGAALVQSGRLPEAIARYREALSADPNFADAHCNLGEASLLAGDLTQALASFATAIQLKPDHAKAHNNFGVALLQAGRIPEAIDHGEIALRLDPRFSEAHYNLGNALARAGHAEEAIGHFEIALRLDPHFAKAHNNLGAMLLRAGRTSEAAIHFEAALQINPDYAEARRNLAVIKGRK